MTRRRKAAPAAPPQQPVPSDDREENAGEYDIQIDERLASFLKPIRDLGENWKIDIASTLEEYLEEIGHIHITTDPNEQGQKLDFAKAALLLQGTTAVYSKKVDYLYLLCNELIQAFAQRAARAQQDNENGDNAPDQAADPIGRRGRDFDDEFLPLDDIQVCKDLDLTESETSATSRTSLIRPPMPLSLVPLEDFEKSQMPLVNISGQVLGRRDDFWMNTAKIHPGTGALLLDACNAALITASTSADTFVPCGNNRSFGILNITPSSPSAIASQHLAPDQRAEGLLEEPPAAGETTFGGDDDGGGGFDHDDTIQNYDPVTEAATTVANPPPPLQDAERAKKFGLLAPEKVTKKRKTRKELMNQILADPWQEIDSLAEEKDESAAISIHVEKKKKGRTYNEAPTDGILPIVASGENGQMQLPDKPVADYFNEFYSHQRNMPKESWKISNYHALLDVFWSERKARLIARAQRKSQKDGDGAIGQPQNKKRRQSELDREQEDREANLSQEMRQLFDDLDVGGGANDDDDNDEGGGDMLSDGDDVDQLPNNDDVVIPGFDALPTDDNLASMTYEELVKIRLEKILAEAANNVILGDITRRVQEWEKKITPALLEDESRRRFDIHEYGDDVLEFFNETESNEGSDNPSYDFSQFAKTQPQGEVCRYFLADLMLANTGNVELKTSGEEGTEECINTLNLTLLSMERHHEHLEEFAAPSARDHN